MNDGTAAEETRITPPESGADFNPIEDVIYRRRSVRYYKDKQVPEYLVRRLLETARFGPTAGNSQPWKFIVVREPSMIAEMSEDVLKTCRRVMWFFDYITPGKEGREWRARLLSRFLPNMCHPVPYGAMNLMAEGKLGVWHGAPTVILILVDTRCPGHPAIDAGIAGDNLVLTAHSYGLGTCWVSFVTALAFQWKWRRRLGIRHPYQLLTSIAVGYPRGNPDGYVTRETTAVDWYEDHTMKVVY